MDTLHNLSLVETYGVDYTTFKLDLVGRHWWRIHLVFRPAVYLPLIYTKFFEDFLEKYMPRSLKDQFSRLENCSNTIVGYDAWFYKLDRYVISILPIEYEQVW